MENQLMKKKNKDGEMVWFNDLKNSKNLKF